MSTSSTSSRSMITLAAGIAVGGLLVAVLSLSGVFDEKPGIEVDEQGVEINLPKKIDIGKK